MGGINIGVILLLPSAVLVSICLLIGARWGVGGAGLGVCSLGNKRKFPQPQISLHATKMRHIFLNNSKFHITDSDIKFYT